MFFAKVTTPSLPISTHLSTSLLTNPSSLSIALSIPPLQTHLQPQPLYERANLHRYRHLLRYLLGRYSARMYFCIPRPGQLWTDISLGTTCSYEEPYSILLGTWNAIVDIYLLCLPI